MALTYTPKGELGSRRPDFELPDVFGNTFASSELDSVPVSVIAFICGHCPYVQAIEGRLIQLGLRLKEHSAKLVGICSNDSSEYPEDRPEALKERAIQKNYSFPILIDQDQSVAHAFGAVCTPDFFVYDGSGSLVYRGRLDDSWKNEALVKSEELWLAAESLLQKRAVPKDQHPSLGCSIKWK